MGRGSGGGGGPGVATRAVPAYNFYDDPRELARIEIVLEEIFGRETSIRELMAATGLPAGANVEITPIPGGMDVTGWKGNRNKPDYYIRQLFMTGGEMFTGFFGIFDAQSQGRGTAWFAKSLRGAAKLGVKKITLDADRLDAGARPHNGYYTWPRLGFNGPLSPGIRAQLPPGLRMARDVSDLMKTGEGRAWWKANGESMEKVSFDLRPGSLSRRVFNAYLAERKSR